MPEHELVEACVLVDGQPLKEFALPDDEGTDGEIVRYIEAMAGKRYEVRVTARVGWRIEGAEYIRFGVNLDGTHEIWHVYRHQSSNPTSGVLLKQRDHVFDHEKVKKGMHEWKKALFEFSALRISK